MADEKFILKIVFPYSNNQYFKSFDNPEDLVKFIEEKYLNRTKFNRKLLLEEVKNESNRECMQIVKSSLL